MGFSALCYWSAVCESEAQRADRRWPSAAAAYGERAFRHGGSRGENVVDYGYVESFEFFGTAAFYHSGYVLRRASRERRVWVAWARTATRLSPTGMPVASDMPPGYFLALVVAPPEVFAVVHGNGQQNVDSLYGRWRVGYQFCGEGTSEGAPARDGRNTWRGVSAAQTRSLGCSETIAAVSPGTAGAFDNASVMLLVLVRCMPVRGSLTMQVVHSARSPLIRGGVCTPGKGEERQCLQGGGAFLIRN